MFSVKKLTLSIVYEFRYNPLYVDVYICLGSEMHDFIEYFI